MMDRGTGHASDNILAVFTSLWYLHTDGCLQMHGCFKQIRLKSDFTLGLQFVLICSLYIYI